MNNPQICFTEMTFVILQTYVMSLFMTNLPTFWLLIDIISLTISIQKPY